MVVIGNKTNAFDYTCHLYFTIVDLYESTGESLGEGAFGRVQTFRNIAKNQEFAVKVIILSINSHLLVASISVASFMLYRYLFCILDN